MIRVFTTSKDNKLRLRNACIHSQAATPLPLSTPRFAQNLYILLKLKPSYYQAQLHRTCSPGVSLLQRSEANYHSSRGTLCPLTILKKIAQLSQVLSFGRCTTKHSKLLAANWATAYFISFRNRISHKGIYPARYLWSHQLCIYIYRWRPKRHSYAC